MTIVAQEGPIEIHIDENPENPREWCNLGTFWGFHRRYLSPDPIPSGTEPTDVPKDAICLPVWLYDHGGTAYVASESNPFQCPWDSGQFGWIFVTKADLREKYGWKRISPKRAAQVKECLASEVETYSQYANGEVYGYVNTETGDSCLGYYSIEAAMAKAMAE